MPCSFAGSPGHIHLAFQAPVHTHFSQMGRKVQCHLGENSRASALPAIQGLCHMDAHTGACTHLHIHIYVYTPTYAHTHPPHIYTHMCMHTHKHLHTHAHAPTCTHTRTYRDSWVCTVRAQRMGTLSKSVCKLLLLSPWISQQESDVSVVQAQGGLSKACLPGLGISTLHTLGSSDSLLFPRPLRSPQRLSQSPL